MDYEKKYNEALEWARKVMQGKIGFVLDEVLEKFPELKESEDEQIRKELIEQVAYIVPNDDEVDNEGNVLPTYQKRIDKYRVWLEKEAEHANFRNNIQVGDKVTRNEAGVLVNISQLNRIAKPRVTNKIEPKFHEGDWVILTAGELSATLQIVNVDTNKKLYWFNDSSYLPIVDEECLHLWTIKDAKDGDVLTFSNGFCGTIICKSTTDYDTRSYCRFVSDSFITKEESGWSSKLLIPATQSQKETLFKAMKEAGYEWDAEKKELRKIEQKPAERSEEDEKILRTIISDGIRGAEFDMVQVNWLKSLKERYTWKPSEEQMEVLLSEVTAWTKGCHKQKVLESLYQDLKKLKS